MKGFRKALKIVGALSLLILLAIGGFIGWLSYQQQKYSKTAAPYVKSFIPELARWDIPTVKGYMAPETLEQITDENLKGMFNQLTKLGSLKSVEDPTLVQIGKTTAKEKEVRVLTYIARTEFDSGEAFVEVSLVPHNDSFKVLLFNVNSKALYQPAQAVSVEAS